MIPGLTDRERLIGFIVAEIRALSDERLERLMTDIKTDRQRMQPPAERNLSQGILDVAELEWRQRSQRQP